MIYTKIVHAYDYNIFSYFMMYINQKTSLAAVRFSEVMVGRSIL